MRNNDARRQQIIAYISNRGFATPEELSQHCAVAAITIRRDLTWLEDAGLLKRVNCGAVPVDAPLTPIHVNVRLEVASVEKQAIARAAASQVSHGERLFLDAGSTCYFLAEALPIDRDLTVITHSLANIQALTKKSGIHVINPGGEFDTRLNAFVGSITEDTLSTFHVDKAFLGATGVDLIKGFTENSMLEERIKQRMAANAQTSIMMVDSSKFGHTAFRSVLKLKHVAQIITDKHASEEFCKALREIGIQVIRAA